MKDVITLAMSYSPTQFEIAAGRMVDLAFPTQRTPSRQERVAEFEVAVADLAHLSQEALTELANTSGLHHAALVPLGIYATRVALASLIKADKVDYEIARLVAEELQELCSHLRPSINLSPKDGQTVGFAAELGVANMIWTGIAEKQLDLSYGLLMGISGYDRRRSGLKRDVDLVAKANDSGRQARRKVQIKTSSKHARNIYDDDIVVVAAQDLVKARRPVDAVVKLLDWNNVDSIQRISTFRALEGKLNFKQK